MLGYLEKKWIPTRLYEHHPTEPGDLSNLRLKKTIRLPDAFSKHPKILYVFERFFLVNETKIYPINKKTTGLPGIHDYTIHDVLYLGENQIACCCKQTDAYYYINLYRYKEEEEKEDWSNSFETLTFWGCIDLVYLKVLKNKKILFVTHENAYVVNVDMYAYRMGLNEHEDIFFLEERENPNNGNVELYFEKSNGKLFCWELKDVFCMERDLKCIANTTEIMHKASGNTSLVNSSDVFPVKELTVENSFLTSDRLLLNVYQKGMFSVLDLKSERMIPFQRYNTVWEDIDQFFESKNGWFLVGYDSYIWNQTIYVWDKKGKLVVTIVATVLEIISISVDNDDGEIIIGMKDGGFCVWRFIHSESSLVNRCCSILSEDFERVKDVLPDELKAICSSFNIERQGFLC